MKEFGSEEEPLAAIRCTASDTVVIPRACRSAARARRMPTDSRSPQRPVRLATSSDGPTRRRIWLVSRWSGSSTGRSSITCAGGVSTEPAAVLGGGVAST